MPNDKETPDGSNDEQSSSWFGSWFERDVRGDIHEQLNAFEERKKKHEEAQRERQRFLEKHRASPFPFFFPPDNKNQRNDDRIRQDEFDDFFGRFPPGWQRPDLDKYEDQHQQSIDDLHQEMQNLFEAAFTGANMGAPNGRGGWSSSSTVVSSSNGTSYTMKQDSKNGARVDLQLPKSCQSENVALEVLRDDVCRIRWKDETNETNNKYAKSNHAIHGQVLELGNSVDCGKLSASISEARRTLTVQAPPKGKEESQSRSLKPQSYPRPVRVTKKQ